MAGATVTALRSHEDGYAPIEDAAVSTDALGRFWMPATGDAIAAQADVGHTVLAQPSTDVAMTLRLVHGRPADAFGPEALLARAGQAEPAPERPEVSTPAAQSVSIALPAGLQEALDRPPVAVATGVTNPVVNIIVHGTSFPWTIAAPLPADLNGDLILDGTVTITPTLSLGTSASICLDLSYVHLLGGRSLDLGVSYEGTLFYVFANSIPSSLSMCVYPDDGRITFTSSNPSGGVTFYVAHSGTELTAILSSMPRTADLTIEPSSNGETTYVDYVADRSTRLQLVLDGPKYVLADINRVPASWHASFRRYDFGSHHNLDLDFSASSGISSLDVEYRDSAWASDYIVANLDGIPASLNADVYWQGSSGNIHKVHYDHAASSSLTRAVVGGQTDGSPLYMQLENLPQTVTRAKFERYDYSSQQQGSLDYSATGSMRDVIVSMGTANTKNRFYVNAPYIPSTLDADWYAYAGSGALESFYYGHSASSSVGYLRILMSLDYDDLNVDAVVEDIPATTTLFLRLRNLGGGETDPYVYLESSSGGLDIQAYVDGHKFGNGGYVYADIDNLPRKFRTTLTDAWNNIKALDFDARGTGHADKIYLWANLPDALKDLPTNEIGLYMEDVERLKLEFKALWPVHKRCYDQDLGLVCIKLVERDADYAWLYHGDFVFHPTSWLTISPNDLEYRGQREEWCWSGYWVRCYVDRYYATSPDWAIYDPSYFSSSDNARLMGYK